MTTGPRVKYNGLHGSDFIILFIKFYSHIRQLTTRGLDRFTLFEYTVKIHE